MWIGSSHRFCQVVEAEIRIRQAGASPQFGPPFRQPAPYLSLRPHSRLAASSVCGTPARTAEAGAGDSGGPWAHMRTKSAGPVPLTCPPAGDMLVGVGGDASAHRGCGDGDSGGGRPRAGARVAPHRSSAASRCSARVARTGALGGACGQTASPRAGGGGSAPACRGRCRPDRPRATGNAAGHAWLKTRHPDAPWPLAARVEASADAPRPAHIAAPTAGWLHR